MNKQGLTEEQYVRQENEMRIAKEITNKLSDYVNVMGRDKKPFIEAFKREHRTLQQSMFRMFLELMEEMASENYHTDARNEDSKKMAKTLLEGFKIAKKKEYIAEGVSEDRAEAYVSTGNCTKPSRYLGTI